MLGFAAVNTGNNLLYLLLGWLLSVIVASGILSESTLRRLLISRRAPPEIFAQKPFLMEVSVMNPKKRVASFSVQVEDMIDEKPLDKRCFFLKVPAGQTIRTSYRHTFSHRGLYRFTGYRIATTFPFALFNKSRRLDNSTEVLVYPALKPIPMPSPRARNQGAIAVGRVGRRGEFFGLREYREGDDRSAIHWRSSARANRMLVREYEEEAQRHATLLLDNALSPTGDEDAVLALERAISLAASLAASYIKSGYAVRLVTRGKVVPFAGGSRQLTRVLRTLALLPAVDHAVPFSAQPEPQGDNLLVVASAAELHGKPHGITHVMEAT